MTPRPSTIAAAPGEPEPGRDCPICPRLVAFREEWRGREPAWHNAPVPTLLPVGGRNAVEMLVVGLAPGVRGANRTGRPFTGDYAGDLLYATLSRFGFANDRFAARTDDGLELYRTAITNSVRCVPPENKPVGAEIANCRRFLEATLAEFPHLRCIVTLGRIAHDSTVRTLSARLATAPFGHGASHAVGSLQVISSYHCSRYNTNTGRLTEAMFVDVFDKVATFLGPHPA